MDEPTEDTQAGTAAEAADEDGTEKLSVPHAAGVRMLRARYRLPSDCAVLMTAAAVATAAGPTALVRNVFGADLPMSLDILFCAESGSLAAAAVAGAFQIFYLTFNEKLRWRDAAGSRRLRAEFVEVLTALENVEKEFVRLAVPPESGSPLPKPNPEEALRRTRDMHQGLEERRQALRFELMNRRLDLLPYLVGEDIGWDGLFKIDKLAFDRTFTNLCLSGSGLREALAAKPRELQRIARFLQASRRGSHFTSGSTVLLNPELISLGVVDRNLASRAFHCRDVREAGFLDGLILEVPCDASRLDAAAFIDDGDEKVWHELISTLFTARMRGLTKLYTANTGAFNACEDFRDWCRKTGAEMPVTLQRMVAAWPAILLKLALAFHLAAGKAEDETIEAETVQLVVELLKRVGTGQLDFLLGLDEETSPEDDAVDRMVERLRFLGGHGTKRDLFRRFGGQDYRVLTPVLDRAVSLGRIIRDGTALRLSPDASADPLASTSTCQ